MLLTDRSKTRGKSGSSMVSQGTLGLLSILAGLAFGVGDLPPSTGRGCKTSIEAGGTGSMNFELPSAHSVSLFYLTLQSDPLAKHLLDCEVSMEFTGPCSAGHFSFEGLTDKENILVVIVRNATVSLRGTYDLASFANRHTLPVVTCLLSVNEPTFVFTTQAHNFTLEKKKFFTQDYTERDNAIQAKADASAQDGEESVGERIVAPVVVVLVIVAVIVIVLLIPRTREWLISHCCWLFKRPRQEREDRKAGEKLLGPDVSLNMSAGDSTASGKPFTLTPVAGCEILQEPPADDSDQRVLSEAAGIQPPVQSPPPGDHPATTQRPPSDQPQIADRAGADSGGDGGLFGQDPGDSKQLRSRGEEAVRSGQSLSPQQQPLVTERDVEEVSQSGHKDKLKETTKEGEGTRGTRTAFSDQHDQPKADSLDEAGVTSHLPQGRDATRSPVGKREEKLEVNDGSDSTLPLLTKAGGTSSQQERDATRQLTGTEAAEEIIPEKNAGSHSPLPPAGSVGVSSLPQESGVTQPCNETELQDGMNENRTNDIRNTPIRKSSRKEPTVLVESLSRPETEARLLAPTERDGAFLFRKTMQPKTLAVAVRRSPTLVSYHRIFLKDDGSYEIEYDNRTRPFNSLAALKKYFTASDGTFDLKKFHDTGKSCNPQAK